MSRRILVIHNPVAGRRGRNRLRNLQARLADRGFDVRVRPTTHRGDGADAARSARGIDIIVAAGGDGTVNEVVAGLLARDGTEPLPAIAFFPMGTANVLAWELALPRRPADFVRMLEQGAILETTPALVNGRPFLLMASAGLDARAVAAVNGRTKRRIGAAAYVLAAFKALRQAPPRYSVVVDGRTVEAATVIVSRARHYGGPFVLCPAAGLDTPDFHVVALESYGWRAAIRYAIALVRGRLTRLADVTVIRGARVDIHGPVGDPVQIDGDAATSLPAAMTLAPRKISLTVPGRRP